MCKVLFCYFQCEHTRWTLAWQDHVTVQTMMPSLYCKWGKKKFHTLTQAPVYITSKVYECGNVHSLPPTGKKIHMPHKLNP